MFDTRGPRIDTHTNAHKCIKVSSSIVAIEAGQLYLTSTKPQPAPLTPFPRGQAVPRTANMFRVSTPIEQLVLNNVLYNIAIEQELRDMIEAAALSPYMHRLDAAHRELNFQKGLLETEQEHAPTFTKRLKALPWWRRVLVALRNNWETV